MGEGAGEWKDVLSAGMSSPRISPRSSPREASPRVSPRPRASPRDSEEATPRTLERRNTFRNSIQNTIRNSFRYSIRRIANSSSAPDHPITREVQRSEAATRRLLGDADEVHLRCINAELDATGDPEYTQREVLETERNRLREDFARRLAELDVLLDGIELPPDLALEAVHDLGARIDLDHRLCQDELALLSCTSALENIPQRVVRQLSEARTGGLRASSWDASFSPLHWACWAGRRDVCELIVRMRGGQEVLGSLDESGRTPLHYAQQCLKQTSLAEWLRERVGVELEEVAAEIGRPTRPDVAKLPAPYLYVLEQVENEGWEKMDWKNGWTLLHWAAKAGHADVCEYLMALRADARSRDAQGKSPIDLAEAGLAETLRSLDERPWMVGWRLPEE